jgi:serine/threonine protein kinase
MRRIKAAKQSEIAALYGSHKAVLQGLLYAGLALRSLGILHRDMSLGNILFDMDRNRFVFIDADDACLLPAAVTCTDSHGMFTPGFVHWETETHPEVKRVLQILSTKVTGADRFMNAPAMYAFSPLKLEHQMTHGLISAAAAIAESGVSVRSISQDPNERSIMFVVNNRDYEASVRALHQAFHP